MTWTTAGGSVLAVDVAATAYLAKEHPTAALAWAVVASFTAIGAGMEALDTQIRLNHVEACLASAEHYATTNGVAFSMGIEMKVDGTELKCHDHFTSGS